MIKYFSCEIYSLNKRKISELCDGLTRNSKQITYEASNTF